MEAGYVLDFSNNTIEEYFEDEFNIQFYDKKFVFKGESKAKILRAIWETHSGPVTAEILRKLWEYRSTLPTMYKKDNPDDEDRIAANYFKVVQKLEGDAPVPALDALDVFDLSNTLGELLNSIERDVRANTPQAALDRLHTYCQKKFRHLIEKRDETVDQSEPLNSRVGRYCKLLEREQNVSEMSLQIIKNSISIFEKFNGVRNNMSLAHDNTILEMREARALPACFES